MSPDHNADGPDFFYCSDFRLLNKTLHFILIFDVEIHIWLIITCLDVREAKISLGEACNKKIEPREQKQTGEMAVKISLNLAFNAFNFYEKSLMRKYSPILS